MLCAVGNPDGFMAGFIATLAEYVKNELSDVSYYPDGWEKPEAAMTDEEKIASRARFDEEVARTIENNGVTEEDKEQAYQKAAAQARESIGRMFASAEGFRSSCARYVTKPARAMVVSEGGYSFEEKTAEKIDQSITALGEIIKGDRNWFDLARSHLPESDWKCVEVYEGDWAATAPIPIVRPTLNRPARALLDKARELIQTPYVEAAANYARQAFELGVRAACELKRVEMRYCVDPKAHQAQDFLDKLKAWKATGSVKQADWDAAIQRLELLKNVVMNPYSHPSAPNIPKQEVEQAIDAVGNFLKLAAQK